MSVWLVACIMTATSSCSTILSVSTICQGHQLSSSQLFCAAAVDSHVAHHLLEKCILGALAEKTRVLITHHLEVLPHADYILVMEDGAVTQQGTYETLRRAGGTFTELMDEYGNAADETSEEAPKAKEKKKDTKDNGEKKEGSGVKLMQDEERNTGSVDWSVYVAYAKAMGANGWLLVAATLLILAQCSQVGNTLFLGFWSGQSISGFRQGDYMVRSAGMYPVLHAYKQITSGHLCFIRCCASTAHIRSLLHNQSGRSASIFSAVQPRSQGRIAVSGLVP